MSVVVWLLMMMMMMMMMKSDADPAEIIRVSTNSSKSIVLSSGLQGDPRKRGYDVRWTRIPDLLLNWNRIMCSDGRCLMLPDGSLKFSRLQTRDSGNYKLEVFDEKGQIFQTKHFLLQVTDSSSSSHVVSSVSVCVILLILLLFFIVVFILRRVQRKMTTGQREENVYVVMKGCPGNKNKEEEKEKKPEKEEEPCVSCSPTVSSQHEDNIYV